MLNSIYNREFTTKIPLYLKIVIFIIIVFKLMIDIILFYLARTELDVISEYIILSLMICSLFSIKNYKKIK